MIYVYDLMIREFHLDTFAHVNNATYLSIMEEARWEMITQRGYGLAKVRESHEGPVILEVNLKFMKELRLREKIKVTCQLLEYPGKVGKLKQQILKEDGDMAAEAIFTFGLFDLRGRMLVLPTPAWKVAVGL